MNITRATAPSHSRGRRPPRPRLGAQSSPVGAIGRLSFIVPAHNEAASIVRTVAAIHQVATAVELPYEVIVVDDASSDATAELARQQKATVLSVQHRQIAATRNAGGRAARGDALFFIDADTTINEPAVRAALASLERGAAGGGAPVRFVDRVPLYARLLLWWLGWVMRFVGMTGGAFLFCTRGAFEAVGGFDERLFGGEDAAMCWALKREGRFVVLWRHVYTSGRRARGINGVRMMLGLLRLAFFPWMLKRRARVQQIWYESDRSNDNAGSPDSIAVRLFNLVALLFMILVITGPVWLIPWPEKLFVGPLGWFRSVSQIFGLQMGLLLWPCTYFLVRLLLRQKRWIERLKLLLLSALCAALAWGNLREFIWFWTDVFRWMKDVLHT